MHISELFQPPNFPSKIYWHATVRSSLLARLRGTEFANHLGVHSKVRPPPTTHTTRWSYPAFLAHRTGTPRRPRYSTKPRPCMRFPLHWIELYMTPPLWRCDASRVLRRGRDRIITLVPSDFPPQTSLILHWKKRGMNIPQWQGHSQIHFVFLSPGLRFLQV
jgi:hypothetical protein